MLKYLSLDEYTTVTWPCLSDHSTLAFPLNFTSRESTSQSLATSSVTWPDTLSPLVNVSLSLIGLYVTLRLLTVPGMLLLIRGKLSRKQDLEWLSQRGGRRPAYHQTGPHPLSASACLARGWGKRGCILFILNCTHVSPTPLRGETRGNHGRNEDMCFERNGTQPGPPPFFPPSSTLSGRRVIYCVCTQLTCPPSGLSRCQSSQKLTT